MSNNQGGAGGAAGVFLAMGLAYWLAMAMAIAFVGMVVATIFGLLLVAAGVVGIVKGYAQADAQGRKILTFLPMVMLVGLLGFTYSPYYNMVADTVMGGSPLVGFAAVLGAIGCVIAAPFGTYSLAVEDYDRTPVIIISTVSAWLYLGMFGGLMLGSRLL